MTLRKHQAEMLDICNGIIGGSAVRKIILHVTPGGGKSMIPIIMGKLIPTGLADALCWVTPRSSLQDQGERNFLDPFFRNLFNHTLTIRSSTNENNPCRGHNGFITTYQAIGMDSRRLVAREIKRKKYILVFDEFHHVEEEGVWHNALQPLVDNASYLVLMTGTLQRGDRKPIAFTPYEKRRGKLQAVLQGDAETAIVRYTRQDALREKAILPLKFYLSDGEVSWFDQQQKKHNADLQTCYKDISSAIYTALNSKYADELLQTGLSHWQNHRTRNPFAKLLIVCADYKQAKRISGILNAQGLKSDIATSHESDKAIEAIKGFKYGNTDILVCIQMCYEGLDVPSATHVICLTHIRSVPWIEQMVSRTVRVDTKAGPYEDQEAYIFAPDDILFRNIVRQIRLEQAPVLKERKDKEAAERAGNRSLGGERQNRITPLESRLTGQREISISGPPGAFASSPAPYIPTPKEIESELLSKIETHVRIYSYTNRFSPKRINAVLKDIFNKSRREMTRIELEKCLKYVRENYPTAFPVRGSGRRVSTKAERWYG